MDVKNGVRASDSLAIDWRALPSFPIENRSVSQ